MRTGAARASAVTADAADRLPSEVVAAARRAVRDLLLQSPGFAQADPGLRRELAAKMVHVALVGADLAAEELRPAPPRPRPLAAAQEAPKEDFRAARSAAGTVAALRKAIDFPAYVTSLINGVFQAISNSNLQQITAISELLDNVSASAEDFTMQNVDDAAVLAWSTGKFPFLARDGGALVVREGVELADLRSTLKGGLGASDEQVDAIDAGDLEGTFLPLARAKMGKDRQQILGTLIQMGLQRVVVDEGRLHASMDMRVDARSIEAAQHASQTADSIAAGASGGGAIGPFSVSASFSAAHSSVQSDSDVSKDELQARAGLRSSVDLAFRTEQVPLDRLADAKARVKLDKAARVPADVSAGPSPFDDKTSPAGAGGSAEKLADDARKGVDKQLDEERKAAEKRAAEKKAEEKEKEKEKKAAEEKAAAEKAAAEKAAAEKAAAEKAAGEKAAEKKAAEERQRQEKPGPQGATPGPQGART